MSNFVIAIGGSGAKLMQAMVHLGAAGLLPPDRRELSGQLVDPDENNGNVEECVELFRRYQRCRTLVGMHVGTSDLFSAAIELQGPYTPLADGQADTLKHIFRYNQLVRQGSVDAELLELFFEAPELEMSIRQGFRGRPAVGATVLAEAVRFDQPPWSHLKEKIRGRGAQGAVRVMLAGSVFGGSGAAGVPTLVRMLHGELSGQVPDLQLGLVLFLPYFQFRPVAGETIQADPAAFPIATAEALKYYHEGGFLALCQAIYCVGEEVPSDVAVPAVGAAEQRNEPHFVELVAGLGAVRFFDDRLPSNPSVLAVAGRARDASLGWDDLPYDYVGGKPLVRQLQTMASFAVAYRYLFFPTIVDALDRGSSDAAFWVDHIERQRKVNRQAVGEALRELYEYLERFLIWLLRVSTPRRESFVPGLVNPNAFAVREAGEWRLKRPDEFNDGDFANLLLNQNARRRLDTRAVFERAARAVADPQATGAGRLVRALYDACRVD